LAYISDEGDEHEDEAEHIHAAKDERVGIHRDEAKAYCDLSAVRQETEDENQNPVDTVG